MVLGVNGFGVDCAGKPGGGMFTLPRLFGATSGDIVGLEAMMVVVVAVLAPPTDGDLGMDGIVAPDLWRTLTDQSRTMRLIQCLAVFCQSCCFLVRLSGP